MKINLDKFNSLVEEKLIYRKEHAKFDLVLYDYAPRCQYEKIWTEETMISRGLITDKEGNIVARPFKKFFNYSEMGPGFTIEENFTVTEKLDGSMGLLYPYKDKFYIATRGSFYSNQAKQANRILNEKYSHVKFDPSISYVFEIIYPSNRIVVKYDDTDLYLLATIDPETGFDVEADTLGFKTPRMFDGKTVDDLLSHSEQNFEGFVIKYDSGLRLKVKLDEYIRLHRIVTGVNTKNIWEALMRGDPIDEWLDKVPDEFYTWVKAQVGAFNAAYLALETKAQEAYDKYKHLDRKEFAIEIMNNHKDISHFAFNMYTNKPNNEAIWKALKPERAENPFQDRE